MAQQLADRVKETTTTTGTGAISLGGAMTGFQAFSAICANGDTCYYAMQSVDSNGNPLGTWETGLGTYATAGNTLTRTTVFSSSNGGAAVTLPTGTTQVWMDLPASKLPLQGMGDWLDTLNVASPNATIPVVALSPNNATANVDVSIVPKGTGAFQAAIPNGTATGGNKRGNYAIDLQCYRATASQVASGFGAVALGNQNIASGNNSGVLSGQGNSASGSPAVVCGGLNNAASGAYSAVLGGIGTVANGTYSASLGAYATTNGITGQVALGHGSSALGKFQRTLTQVRASTTSTTATVATADAASAAAANQLTLRNKSASRVRVNAVAFDATNFTDAKEWTADVLIVRGATAASTAIVGSPTVTTTYATAGASGWTLALTADTTNGALQSSVIGSATDTVDWNIQYDAIEVM